MSYDGNGMSPSALGFDVPIDIKSMPPIAYKGTRVLTSALLSSLYETDEKKYP
jgi:hypothetical protein